MLKDLSESFCYYTKDSEVEYYLEDCPLLDVWVKDAGFTGFRLMGELSSMDDRFLNAVTTNGTWFGDVVSMDSNYIYVLSQEGFIETVRSKEEYEALEVDRSTCVGAECWGGGDRVTYIPALYIHERADTVGYNQTKLLLEEYSGLLDYAEGTKLTMDSHKGRIIIGGSNSEVVMVWLDKASMEWKTQKLDPPHDCLSDDDQWGLKYPEGFGQAVSIYGDYAAVGAFGYIFVYQFGNQTWSMEVPGIEVKDTDQSLFGNQVSHMVLCSVDSVVVSSNVLIAGSVECYGGAVFVYSMYDIFPELDERCHVEPENNNSFLNDACSYANYDTQPLVIKSITYGIENKRFGTSVAYDSGLMVVSAPLVVEHGGLGALYLFNVRCDEGLQNVDPVSIISSRGTYNSKNQFGKDLVIQRNENGTVILASSPYADGPFGTNGGAVYVFREHILGYEEDYDDETNVFGNRKYFNESIMVPSPSNGQAYFGWSIRMHLLDGVQTVVVGQKNAWSDIAMSEQKVSVYELIDKTEAPTPAPTFPPTLSPTMNPSNHPTGEPTKNPTNGPSTYPTKPPTMSPTINPSNHPTGEPTKNPTNSPSTSPTTHPTESPTTSPLFSQHDSLSAAFHGMEGSLCVDVATCPNDKGITCCNDGGGYMDLMLQIRNPGLIRDISSDFDLHEDFTFSFWVQIISDDSRQTIMTLTHAEDPPRTHDVLYVQNQKVVFEFNGFSQQCEETKQSNISKCESKVLSSVNPEYYHFISIQISHESRLQRFTLWLNNDVHQRYFYQHSLSESQITHFDTDTRTNFGDLKFTRHAMKAEEISHFYDRHLSMWDKVHLTAWGVPIACGSITGTLLLYGWIGYKVKKADKPHYIYILSVGLALLDVASDYYMAIELYKVNDPWWPVVVGFILLPTILGMLYFSYWYRKQTTIRSHDFLQSWLLKYRLPFLILAFLSSSNLGLLKLMLTRVSALYKPGFFNIPLLHEQFLSLQRGNMINLLFEELPLFVIQIHILISTDMTSNSSDGNANTQLSVVIALGSTLLGMLAHCAVLFATHAHVGERELRRGYLRVVKPTTDLRLHTNDLSEAFSYGMFYYKAFVRISNKAENEYEILVYHDKEQSKFQRQVVSALRRFCDEQSEVYLIMEPTAHRIAQNIIEIDALLDSSHGEVQILLDKSELSANFKCPDNHRLKDLTQISPIEEGNSFTVKDLLRQFGIRGSVQNSSEINLSLEMQKSLRTERNPDFALEMAKLYMMENMSSEQLTPMVSENVDELTPMDSEKVDDSEYMHEDNSSEGMPLDPRTLSKNTLSRRKPEYTAPSSLVEAIREVQDSENIIRSNKIDGSAIVYE